MLAPAALSSVIDPRTFRDGPRVGAPLPGGAEEPHPGRPGSNANVAAQSVHSLTISYRRVYASFDDPRHASPAPRHGARTGVARRPERTSGASRHGSEEDEARHDDEEGRAATGPPGPGEPSGDVHRRGQPHGLPGRAVRLTGAPERRPRHPRPPFPPA